MPVHDWTQVEAGIFHDFHTAWVSEIRSALNEGLLPEGYYALAEQHAGQSIADILTLHASPTFPAPLPPLPDPGGTAVAEAPPRVSRRQTLNLTSFSALRRSVAIRHISEHRLVAMVEIVSPGNKDRREHIEEFANKAASALQLGVHLLVVDLFPPGPHNRSGIHGAILEVLKNVDEEPYELPADEQLTIVSYAAGPSVEVYLEYVSVGSMLPVMPLFLKSDRYVNAPLELMYQEAYRGMPAFWREVLEGRSPA